MAKSRSRSTPRSKLVTTAERIGTTLGRAARRVDNWRGKAQPRKPAKLSRAPKGTGASRGAKAHLQTDATARHDESAAAKSVHALERPKRRSAYRKQNR